MLRKNNKSCRIQELHKILFYLFALIALTVFLYANKNLFFALINISSLDLIFLSLFSLLAIYINAIQLRYLTDVFNVKLKFIEWFGLAVSNTMHNYYIPVRGGTVLKAIYLKKTHTLPYSKFISLTAGAYLLGFFLASVSAIFFILVSFLLYHKFYGIFFYISVSLIAVTTIFGIFCLKVEFSALFKKIPILHNFILKVESGLSYFKKNKGLLIKILVFKFFFILIMSVKLYWAFKAIGIDTNLITILIVQSLVMFSMVISLTPGNLGIREGIIGVLASMLDIPLQEAILGALVDRAVMMSIVIILGMIFTTVLTREIDKRNSSTSNGNLVQMEK